MEKEITSEVKVGDIDGDSLVLRKCVCGQEFDNWDCIIHFDKDYVNTMSCCGRKIFAKISVKVFEIE